MNEILKELTSGIWCDLIDVCVKKTYTINA